MGWGEGCGEDQESVWDVMCKVILGHERRAAAGAQAAGERSLAFMRKISVEIIDI